MNQSAHCSNCTPILYCCNYFLRKFSIFFILLIIFSVFNFVFSKKYYHIVSFLYSYYSIFTHHIAFLVSDPFILFISCFFIIHCDFIILFNSYVFFVFCHLLLRLNLFKILFSMYSFISYLLKKSFPNVTLIFCYCCICIFFLYSISLDLVH